MKELKLLKHELQNVINGSSKQGETDLIQAAKAFLRNNSKASGFSENTKHSRTEEEGALRKFADINHLYFQAHDLGIYITEGAEQKVYYKEEEQRLYKTADAIFYETWSDYLNNLLLHNCFFSDTA